MSANKAESNKMLVRGFGGSAKVLDDDGLSASSSRTDNTRTLPLRWFCAPDSWPQNSGGREGCDGSWKIQDEELHLWPPAKKDFWRQTYYQPLLVKDDGPIMYAILPLLDESSNDMEQQPAAYRFYTITTDFSLTACRQFDQAGLCIRLDGEHWIKTGIEVVDGTPRLSCVVTNVYSDWSTQTWPHYVKRQEQVGTKDGKDEKSVLAAATIVEHVQIRIHCRGTSFVVEAKFGDEWEFIRIAHCSTRSSSSPSPTLATGDEDAASAAAASSPARGTFWAGVFACCPEDQRGGHAIFHDLLIQEGSHMEHNADGNQE